MGGNSLFDAVNPLRSDPMWHETLPEESEQKRRRERRRKNEDFKPGATIGFEYIAKLGIEIPQKPPCFTQENWELWCASAVGACSVYQRQGVNFRSLACGECSGEFQERMVKRGLCEKVVRRTPMYVELAKEAQKDRSDDDEPEGWLVVARLIELFEEGDVFTRAEIGKMLGVHHKVVEKGVLLARKRGYVIKAPREGQRGYILRKKPTTDWRNF